MKIDKQITKFMNEKLLSLLIDIPLYDLVEVEAWISSIRIVLSNHTFKDIGDEHDKYVTTKNLAPIKKQLKEIDYETLREILAERIILTATKDIKEFNQLDSSLKIVLSNLIQKYKDYTNNTYRDNTLDIVQQAMLEMGL